MKQYRLIYTSDVNKETSIEDTERIVERSKTINFNIRTTSLLILIEDMYLHVIEDPEDEVYERFKVIKANKRHCNVKIIHQGEILDDKITDNNFDFRSFNPDLKSIKNTNKVKFMNQQETHFESVFLNAVIKDYYFSGKLQYPFNEYIRNKN